MNQKSFFSFLSLTLVAFSMLLFSFTTKKGGDSFTVYLNDKLLVQQYVLAKKPIETIALTAAHSGQMLSVHYSHCGKIGTGRTLSIKNSANKILKQWQFENVNDGQVPTMSIPVKEILALQNGKSNSPANLYYASNELPEGRLLTTLDFRNDVNVSMR